MTRARCASVEFASCSNSLTPRDFSRKTGSHFFASRSTGCGGRDPVIGEASSGRGTGGKGCTCPSHTLPRPSSRASRSDPEAAAPGFWTCRRRNGLFSEAAGDSGSPRRFAPREDGAPSLAAREGCDWRRNPLQSLKTGLRLAGWAATRRTDLLLTAPPSPRRRSGRSAKTRRRGESGA